MQVRRTARRVGSSFNHATSHCNLPPSPHALLILFLQFVLDKKVKLDGSGHKATTLDNSQVVPSDGEQLLQQILHEDKVITGAFLCVLFMCLLLPVFRSLDWSHKEMTVVSMRGSREEERMIWKEG